GAAVSAAESKCSGDGGPRSSSACRSNRRRTVRLPGEYIAHEAQIIAYEAWQKEVPLDVASSGFAEYLTGFGLLEKDGDLRGAILDGVSKESLVRGGDLHWYPTDGAGDNRLAFPQRLGD